MNVFKLFISVVVVIALIFLIIQIFNPLKPKPSLEINLSELLLKAEKNVNELKTIEVTPERNEGIKEKTIKTSLRKVIFK